MLVTLSLVILSTVCDPNILQTESLTKDTIIKFYVDANDVGECVPHGKWVEYKSNGDIIIDANFHYGEPSGKWKYYRSNGKIKKHITYNDDGVEHGPATYWHVDGSMWQKGFFCSGFQCSNWTRWWPDGTLKSKVVWQSGKINGPILNYYPNGQLGVSGQINNGKRVGHWVWRSDKGDIIKEEIFDKAIK